MGTFADIPQSHPAEEERSSVALPYVQASYAVGDDLALFPRPIAARARASSGFRSCRTNGASSASSKVGRHVPFDIARVYYLYDVPAAAVRGGHAHKNLKQLIIALSGSFDVKLDTGAYRRVVQLGIGPTSACSSRR